MKKLSQKVFYETLRNTYDKLENMTIEEFKEFLNNHTKLDFSDPDTRFWAEMFYLAILQNKEFWGDKYDEMVDNFWNENIEAFYE